MKYLLIILLFASCTVNKYYCFNCKQKKSYAEKIDPQFYLPEYFRMPYIPIDSGIYKWFGIPNGITLPIGEISDTSFLSFTDTIIPISKDRPVVDSFIFKKQPIKKKR